MTLLGSLAAGRPAGKPSLALVSAPVVWRAPRLARAGVRFAVVVGLVGALSGCATFQSKPLVPRHVLEELRRVQLDALQRPSVPAPGQSGPPSAFNLADGVSSDEAVAIALVLNPDIRAFRKERGVAEGELIAAGLLPNPELQLRFLHIENITRSLATAGIDIGLNWAPPRPGERAARQGRARARIEQVRAQIVAEEWQLATDARAAHAGFWVAQARLRFVDASLALQERVRQFLRDKRALGDISRLDANLLELGYTEVRRERELIAAERDRTRLEFNRLLGLPPLADVRLEAPAPNAVVTALPADADALETFMVDRRPDLQAGRQEYEQAEQSLRLAYIQRIPWFRFGPAYARDVDSERALNKYGLGIGIDLPIANLNQGEIARLEAQRDKVRETFVARVHQARAEVNDALRRLRAQERILRLFRDVTAPALDEAAQLASAALELGDVNILQFVTAQDKVLRGRRESLDAELEYWKGRFELERALAARLTEVVR